MNYNNPPSGMTGERPRRLVLGELQGTEPLSDQSAAKRQRVLQPLYSASPSGYFLDEHRPKSGDTTPDVIEHLAKHGGKIRELEQENHTLRRKLQEVSRDLESETSRTRSLQAELAYAQELNSQPNRVSQHSQELLQQEKLRRVSAEDRAEKLNRALEEKAGQLQSLEEEVERATTRFMDERRSRREQVEALQQRLAELQDTFHKQLRSAETETAAAQRRTQAETVRADELEAELQRERAKSRQLSARQVDMEAAAAQLQAAVNREQERQGRVQELEVAAGSLREQLLSAQRELQKARQAQEAGGNVALLKEQLVAAERQLAAAAALKAAHQELQLQCSRLEEEVLGWRDCAKRLPNISKPAELVSSIKALQGELLQRTARVEELQTLQRGLRSDVDAARRERDAAAQALQEKARDVNDAGTALARVKGVVACLTQERQTMQRLLDSYKVLPELGPEAAGAQAQQLLQRYHLLEQEVQQYRQQKDQQVVQVQELVAEVGRLQDELQAVRGAERDAAAGQEAAEAAAASLRRELELVGRELATLQERVGQGGHDNSRVRVLHLKNNPLALARARLTEERTSTLEAENESLRRQVEELTAGRAPGGDGVAPAGAGVEAARWEAEAKVQRRRADEAEKKLQRMKAVFAEGITKFKKHMSQVFGFSITILSEAKHMHAPSSAASTTYSFHPLGHPDEGALLLLRFGGGGGAPGWELLETPYSRELQQDVDAFIGKFKSLPAFMANIAMQLFNSVTHVA